MIFGSGSRCNPYSAKGADFGPCGPPPFADDSPSLFSVSNLRQETRAHEFKASHLRLDPEKKELLTLDC
jgi:hypothetical protein